MRVPCQPQRAPQRRPFPIVAVLVSAAVAASAVWVLCAGKATLSSWLIARGHHTLEHQTTVGRALTQLPKRWLTGAPAPRLELELAFKNVEKLRAMQGAALRAGRITDAAKETVAAGIVADGVRTRAKLRLKGDKLDHINSHKVSFRVQVSEEPPVLGMRTFSLQAPPTKGYHYEALFHASVRFFAQMAPRYEFVRVQCNGDEFGVMALEEHCAKEMMERQGRRESVVVRFEEDQMFAEQARLGSVHAADVAYDDYRSAPVSIIGDGKDHPLQAQALGLLRAFVAGTLTPAQVFDVEAVASYLAVCELWGAWHPLRWHNLRFYLDPVTGRLAPIGFDGNLQMRRPIGQLVTPHEPLIARLLADPVVFAEFHRRLGAVCAATIGGALPAALAAAEAQALPILQTEYLLLQPYPLDELRRRAQHLAAVEAATFRSTQADGGLVPILLASIGDHRFEVRSVATCPVLLLGARWRGRDGVAIPAAFPAELPPESRQLEAKPTVGAVADLGLRMVPPDGYVDADLQIEARLAAVAKSYWVSTVPQPPALHAPLVPEVDLATLLARHPWLQLEDHGASLRILPGTHRVEESLVTPLGFALTAGPGTRLVFAKSAALVTRGPLVFAGRAEAPIELVAADGDWLGLLVLAQGADQVSSWQHVRVRDTTGVAVGPLQMTGGVVFHQGRVVLADVLITGTTAEDALNAIHAEIDFERLGIERTRSDAFDGDFVRGKIFACFFRDIGGDAIDVSGADIVVEECRVVEARDKALSVGERSVMTATRVTGERVGVGAACKDGSTLTLSDSKFVAPLHAGVMSYVKKAEYGACRSTLTNVTVEGPVPAVRVQHGCTMVRDGRAIATEAIDVEDLYSTIMRK